MRVTCPLCGALFDLIQALEDKDGRQWVALLAELPPNVIKPLIRYLHLFKPDKRTLRWARMLKLTRELVPMIKDAQLTRNRLTYVVPPSAWAEAMETLVDNPPPTLQLPLKGNGYLLGMLANGAEQRAAGEERQQEEERRHRGRENASDGPVQVGRVLEGDKPKRSGPPAGWKDKALRGKQHA